MPTLTPQRTKACTAVLHTYDSVVESDDPFLYALEVLSRLPDTTEPAEAQSARPTQS